MKKLNIFLESDEFILDKTEHEKIREELTVDILSTIKNELIVELGYPGFYENIPDKRNDQRILELLKGDDKLVE